MPVPVLTMPPSPETVPAKVLEPLSPPVVSGAAPRITAPLPARLPMLVPKPPRSNVPVASCVTAPMPLIAPVSVIVPALVTDPARIPRIRALAPVALTSPAFSAPVDSSVAMLVTRPETRPAFVNLALLSTPPASEALLPRIKVPPLTVVSPV